MVHETLNQVKEHRSAWLYNPGQRRVRRAPTVAYDNPIPGTEITALFGEDGTVTGSAGCNDYTGTVTRNGDEITIEPWRAKAFPVIRDLIVDRSAFDRILTAATEEALSHDHEIGKEIPGPELSRRVGDPVSRTFRRAL